MNDFNGIIPYGFRIGYDTEMELSKYIEPESVQGRVKSHICTHNYPPTPFSSWSHDWATALMFTYVRRRSDTTSELVHVEDEDCGWIAVLDTWAFGDENMRRNRIFHVPQFRIPNIREMPEEWLIWGPISGPAYRCVSVAAIRETINSQRWPRDLVSKHWDLPFLLPEDVRDSLLLAGCFQKVDDGSSDVMLAVAAAELASRMWGDPFSIEPYLYSDLKISPVPAVWPREVSEALLEMFSLCRPVLSGRPLVHGSTAVVGFPGVQLMYTLLSKIEARWRDSDPDTPWAPVDCEQVWRKHPLLPWGGSPPSSGLEREEDHKR